MSTPNANTAPSSTAPTQNQDRLATFFSNHAADTHPSRWDALWQAGDFLPWDRGFANPALIDTLASAPDWLPSTPLQTAGGRARVLVPGCGKGYDLALFSSYGYDAYGLEISENAVKAAEEWLKDPGDGTEGEYKVHNNSVGKGQAKVLLGDFFTDDWLKGVEGGMGGGFNVIYDNTVSPALLFVCSRPYSSLLTRHAQFLSALPPSLRAPWAARMSQLLALNGVLICLEFPTHKPPKSGGPPWALPSAVYEELFRRPGEELTYDEDGKVIKENKAESDIALVRIAYWKPNRTHQVGIIKGEVKDMVSIWRHK